MTRLARLPIGQLGVIAALSLLSAWPFTEVFRRQDVLFLLIRAALLPVLVAAAVRVTGKPHAAMSVACLTVVWLLFVALAIAGVPDLAATVRGGLVDGWRSLLTTSLPAPARPQLLVVPVAGVWFASSLAAEVLLRTRRLLVPLVPLVVLAVVAAMYTDGASSWPWMAQALLAGGALAFVAMRSSMLSRDARAPDDRLDVLEVVADGGAAMRASVTRNRLMAAVPLIIVLAVVSPLVAGLLPMARDQERFTLREQVSIPERQRDRLNPLAEVGGAATDEAVFTVSVDDTPVGDPRFRVAVLDQFDGATWSMSGEHTTTGPVLPNSGTPQPSTAGDEQRAVRQHIVLNAGGEGWLPALDRPIEIDAPSTVDIQYDAETGTLALPDPPSSPLEYDVLSVTAEPDIERMLSSGVGTGADARAALSTDADTPPAFGQALEASGASRASSPAEQVALLLAYFGNKPDVNRTKAFVVDPSKPVGYASTHIASFLDEQGDRRGPPALFAASFVALAKALGFPARLAVGYQPAEPLLPQSMVTVHTSELTAWAEVKLDATGWVALDVGEQAPDTPPPPEQDQPSPANLTDVTPPPPNEEPAQPPENPNLEPAPAAEDSSDNLATATAVAAVVAVVALGLALTPWLRKRRLRSQRRNAPDPAERIVGAWNEAVDRLIELGMQDARRRTVAETEHEAADRVGAAASGTLHGLGQLNDAALHDRNEPTREMASRAWALSDAFSNEVRAQLTPRERIRSALSNEPLLSGNRRR